MEISGALSFLVAIFLLVVQVTTMVIDTGYKHDNRLTIFHIAYEHSCSM